jgi:hypothetical protein
MYLLYTVPQNCTFLEKMQAYIVLLYSSHPPTYFQSFCYSPTDAQVNYLKNNFKIYIKIDIKTAPTSVGAITIIRERIIRAC